MPVGYWRQSRQAEALRPVCVLVPRSAKVTPARNRIENAEGKRHHPRRRRDRMVKNGGRGILINAAGVQAGSGKYTQLPLAGLLRQSLYHLFISPTATGRNACDDRSTASIGSTDGFLPEKARRYPARRPSRASHSTHQINPAGRVRGRRI
jgi:hypothetical protein